MQEWDELEKVRLLLENEKVNGATSDIDLISRLEGISKQQNLLKTRIGQLVHNQRKSRTFDGENLKVAVLNPKN